MKVYLTKILLWKFTMALVFMFWKCSHMYICIFWHNFAGDMGMFSKRTAGGWVDYDRGSRPRRAELLWCRKGDIFCKISWIWIAKFPICVWSWRCNKLFWFKGTQKSWMHDGSAITEKFQAIWASASGARNWLLGGNYRVQDWRGKKMGKDYWENVDCNFIEISWTLNSLFTWPRVKRRGMVTWGDTLASISI